MPVSKHSFNMSVTLSESCGREQVRKSSRARGDTAIKNLTTVELTVPLEDLRSKLQARGYSETYAVCKVVFMKRVPLFLMLNAMLSASTIKLTKSLVFDSLFSFVW